MKKSVWVLIAWLYAAGCSVWANDPTEWHQGQLVLRNGIEWKGDINYNWLAQIVQYRQGPFIKAYSANQIQGFTFLDDQFSMIRKFVSVDCLAKSGLRRLRILEEIVSGPLLVYREYHPGFDLIKIARPSEAQSDANAVHDVNMFRYQVFFNEELMDMDLFYRTIWPQLKLAFDQELKAYTRLTQIDMMGTVGRIRLICWYNSLTEKKGYRSAPEPDNVSAGH